MYKGESLLNKNDLMLNMQEVGHTSAKRSVMDYLESHGIDVDDISFKFLVNDTSKVKWKSNSKFVKLFIAELEKLMSKKVITVEMLGFVTLLTPYLSYENNCLMNKDNSIMNQNDIIKLSGWGRNKVSQTIKVLIELEIMHEEKQQEDKRKSKYYLNPHLFYKGQKIDKEVNEFYKKSKQ